MNAIAFTHSDRYNIHYDDDATPHLHHIEALP